MRTKAQKWGNSLAVRVPKGAAEKAGIQVEDTLEVDVQGGAIVLRPERHRKYRLNDLVRKITKKNLHGELDFGGPKGREVF